MSDTLFTIQISENSIGINIDNILAFLSFIVASFALWKSRKSVRIQNFESYFETIVTLFVSQWDRIEKHAIENPFLEKGNSWPADFRYLDYFMRYILPERDDRIFNRYIASGEITIKESSQNVNLNFLDEFVMRFYQFGATFLHLYAMIENSPLAKEEKIERGKTISNLLSVHQRRLLYFWCVLANKESDPTFKMLEEVQNSNKTKGFFYHTQLWLKERSWENRLYEWKPKLLEKQKKSPEIINITLEGADVNNQSWGQNFYYSYTYTQ